MKRYILLAVALILSSGSAYASKDWKVTSETDAQGKICVASYQLREDKNDFTLQIRVHDNLASLTEMILSRSGPALAVKGFQARIGNTGPTLQISSLLTQGTVEYYLALPHGNSTVLAAMASTKEFKLLPVGANSPKLEVSLKTFPVAAKALSDCSRNRPFASDEFERILSGTTAMSVDLARLTPNAVQQIRSIASDAYKVFLKRKDNERELANLRKKYATELDRYDQLNSRIRQINGTELPQIASKRAKLVSELSQDQQEQVDTQANLPKYQARVTAAQSAYDQAYNILAPLVPRHNALVSNLSTAQQSLDSTSARLRQVESDLQSHQQELQALQNKLNDLRYQINNLQSQLPNARWDLQQAEQALASFNYQSEVDQYLASHNFNFLQQQESALTTQAQTASNTAAQAQSQMSSAQAALQQCQQTQGANCASQEAAYNNAQSAFMTANQQVNQINSQLQNVRSQMADVQREAKHDADEKLEHLQRRKQNAEYQINNIQQQISQDQLDINDIQNYRIPNLENEINSLQSQRSQLQWQQSSDQSAVASAERELSNYELSVSWNSKKDAVDSTKQELESATRALSYANERLQEIPSEIATYKSDIASLDAKVSQLNTELSQLNAGVAKLQPTVDKYNVEKAPFDQVEAALTGQLNDFSKNYLANLSI